MRKTREFLMSIGMPAGDAYDLPTSDKRFPDGGSTALRCLVSRPKGHGSIA